MNRFLTQITGPATQTGRGLRAGDSSVLSWTSWADVHDTARRVTGTLQRGGVGADSRVAILALHPGHVATVIQGAWLAGACITMLQQPTSNTDLVEWQQSCLKAMATLECSTLLVGGPFMASTESFRAAGITVIEIPDNWEGEEGQIVDRAEHDVAICQLTSGSTGDPKGVEITFANLYANGAAMEAGSLGGPDDDVMVSWLPLSHDMGLVGFLLTPMAYGIETVSVAPTEFLRDPLSWLQLISDYRGTITAAPNFAYSIVRHRLTHIPDGQFDLSALRFALCGAEPIDADTMRSFAAAAARFGFDPGAVVAAYGMAEATLAVSFAHLGKGLIVDTTEDGDAAPWEQRKPREVVLLGEPLLGMEVRVIDPDGADVANGALGEFLIRGEAVTRGYASAAGRIPALDADNWLHTGDLGYLTEDGQIAICGRRKNVIIVAGRNIFPADIEQLAEAVPGVRPGGVVAFGVDRDNGSEEVRVIAEVSDPDALDDRDIQRQIARRIFNGIGVSPRVILKPKGAIPKTPSGKVSHVAAKRIFAEVAA